MAGAEKASSNKYANIPSRGAIERILETPDRFIGSVEKRRQTLWVYENGLMIQKPVTYVPGLYNIFEEILLNAADNPKMDSIKVTIDVESNSISVYYTGDVIHEEEEEEEGKSTLGYLFTSKNKNENWTKITFKPDLARFNLPPLKEDDDAVALMKKRVIDIAACLGETVKVELNGNTIHFASFSSYCKLYTNSADGSSSAPLPRFLEYVNDRCQICITPSNGQFQQVSFVNSIATIEGGTHVDYVTNKIVSHLVSVINKKNEDFHVKPHNVKNHLWVFVKTLIDDPAFDSPTNETLKLGAGFFDPSWDLTPMFLDKVAKSEILNNIEKWALQQDFEKRIAKRHDKAGQWGQKESRKCTLILTQGYARQGILLSGRTALGGRHHGVFSLSGKLLNVREASDDQIRQNAALTEIMYILGLQWGVKYDDAKSLKSLKYRHLMIMTNRNHDGFYFKGLLINLFHTFWPALLKASFLQEFITPIVKAKLRDGEIIKSFYTMPEYVEWKKSMGTKAKNWTIRHYEVLEYHSFDEMMEYFDNFEEHKRVFVWENDEDSDAIELAFSKDKVEARKKWLQKFEHGTFLDHKKEKIKCADFVNKELIYYFIKDHERSIPSIVDGLKPGQREILYSLFKRESVIGIDEIRVDELCGYVSKFSPYYPYKEGLADTIIGMAQDYVGSNNINLLLPIGQFGTRYEGGKDHSSLMFISTQLSPLINFLFPEKDEDISPMYINDDGQSNEDGQSVVHNWYVPIIPMVLVNGSEGTCTVWSSSVPNYNPLDIIENIKVLLKGGEPTMKAMDPWYKGFTGSIKKNTTEDTGASYTTSGKIGRLGRRTFEITELPIRMWTNDYTKFLKSVSSDNDESLEDPPLVLEFCCDNSCGEIVHFIFGMSKEEGEEGLSAVTKEGSLKKLKLTTSVGTSNMYLIDSTGLIKKYETPEEILEEFFNTRLEIYEKRKEFVLANRKKEMLKCENKCRYIKWVGEHSIVLGDKKRADLFRELKTNGFDPFPTNEDEESVENSSDYDYLLSLETGASALENMQAERLKLEKAVEDLKQTNVKSLWMRDLEALERKLTEELDTYQKKWEALREKRRSVAIAYTEEEDEDDTDPQKKNQKTSKTASVEELMEVSENTRTETEKDDGDVEIINDDDFELEEKKKKGSRKAANGKPLAGTKRRGPPSSKQSPDNKVRKLSSDAEEEESDGSDE